MLVRRGVLITDVAPDHRGRLGREDRRNLHPLFGLYRIIFSYRNFQYLSQRSQDIILTFEHRG